MPCGFVVPSFCLCVCVCVIDEHYPDNFDVEQGKTNGNEDFDSDGVIFVSFASQAIHIHTTAFVTARGHSSPLGKREGNAGGQDGYPSECYIPLRVY